MLGSRASSLKITNCLKRRIQYYVYRQMTSLYIALICFQTSFATPENDENDLAQIMA